MGRNEFFSQILRSLAEEDTNKILAEISAKKTAEVKIRTKQQLSKVLVDFKNQIGGNFTIKSCNSNRAILHGCKCPFGSRVIDRPQTCRLTENFFRQAIIQYYPNAKVKIQKSIANGDHKCIISISFN